MNARHPRRQPAKLDIQPPVQDLGARPARRGVSLTRLILKGFRSLTWRGAVRVFASLVLVAGLVAGGYYGVPKLYSSFRDRQIDLCIVTDIEYRVENPEWQSKLKPLFEEVNRLYHGTGVQWRVTFGGEAYPTGTNGDIYQRASLLEGIDSKADVVLGLTARPDRHADSVAYPFSHTLLVRSSAADTQAIAATAIARALANLFGVPVASRTLILTEAQGIFDEPTVKLIREMRNYDFADGISALPGRWEKRATDALARSLGGKPHPEAEAHRILGRAYGQGRRHGDAIRQLREAVRLDPDNSSTHFTLAMELNANLDTQEAVTELKTAARLDPTNAQPHAAAGAILLNANRIEEAVEEFRRAVGLDPQDPSYQAALGAALSRRPGGTRDAKAAFEEAVRLRPLQPGAMAGLMRETSVEEGLQQAIRMLESEARQKPDSSDSHLKLGVAEAQAGNLDGAQKEIRRALELAPSNGTAHLALARVYYLAGRYAEAETEIAAARADGSIAPKDLVETIQRKLGRQTAQ